MISNMSRVSFVNLQCTSYRSNSTEQSPSSEANRFTFTQEIFGIFMEPESSLPHLQVPATRPYRVFYLCVILTRPCTFLGVNTPSWNRGSSVSIVTSLRTGQSRNYVLIFRRE